MRLVGGWMNPSPVLVFWAKSAWWGPEPSVCARWQLGESVPSQASAALTLVLWHHRCHSGLDTGTSDLLIGHCPPARSSLSEQLPFLSAANNFRCEPPISCVFFPSGRYHGVDYFHSKRSAYTTPFTSIKFCCLVLTLIGNILYWYTQQKKWWMNLSSK